MAAIYVKLVGRMGNNMFQLAAAASLAHRMGLPCFACPDPTFWVPEPDNCYLPAYVEQYKETLFRNFRFVGEVLRPYVLCQEVDFAYHSLPQMENLYLSGYFQSERYFHESLVRRLFCIEEDRRQRLEREFGALLHLRPVGINVRRGDYLRVEDWHPVQPLSVGSNCHVVEEISPMDNLYLQSMCEGHIISNSTFSWWGAWLDTKREKKVVCPKRWFGPRLAHLDTSDLIPQGWHRI